MATVVSLRVLRRQSVRCICNSNIFQEQQQNNVLQQNIRQLSSSFVSQGLVSQNVKKFSSSHSQEKSGKVPEVKSYETKVVIREPEIAMKNSPLVLLFGWGGASHKNLSKYADIYVNSGCATAQYSLPTKWVFRDTAQIPNLMENILRQLEAVGVYNRQVYVHCLSDTGVMCYQGMMVSNKKSSRMKRINIRGVVWDSCCGPRPEISVPRVAALLVVNWFCCRRDKMSYGDSFNNCWRLLMDRGWPGLLDKWNGKEVALSLIDGVWSGHWGRDHFKHSPSVSELFIYSNTDFYLPARYLETHVLAPRDQEGAEYAAVKFMGSSHVAHLRKHKEEYVKHVRRFIKMETEEDLNSQRSKQRRQFQSDQFSTSMNSP